jgi:hypothetical protein
VSRFRPRAFPWLFCKTGFAASMPRGHYRAIGDGFCSVKVKLTISAIFERGKWLKLIDLSLFHDFDSKLKS